MDNDIWMERLSKFGKYQERESCQLQGEEKGRVVLNNILI